MTNGIARRCAIPAFRAGLVALVAGAMALSGTGDGVRAQEAASATADIPQLEFEKYSLPNGLDVILHVDRKLPIVHVNQWFHVGSKNEKAGRTGFAHLFEHMMFQGSKNAKGEYFVYAERAGANVFEGGVNGTTSQDRTNYFATVPSGNLENLLWLESDRLATLLEETTEEKLNNQRDVVKNERRQSLENQPYGRWYPLLYEALFPKGHPYSWPVIGSQEDLTAAALEDVKEFFRQYYTPNNLSLVIAGDFDSAEAKRLVAKYFGDLPPGPALDRPARWVSTLEGEKVVEVNDRVSLERVYLGWPTPEYFSADEAALEIAARILTDGLSSRLTKLLVYDKQLATSVSSFNIAGEIGSAFVINATARPGSSLAEIERIITDELARLSKEGPLAEEVDRAKTKRETQFISGLERIGGFGGKADILNQYNVFLGDPGKLEADINRYRAIGPKEVRGVVERWLATRNRAVIRFHPEASSRSPQSLTLDRTTEPPLGADRAFVAPTVRTAKLENGIDIIVVERHDLPKVNISLATRAGAVADPEGKAGVAHLTVTTIDLGTKTRKALEIEEALASLGTALSGGAAREHSWLGIDVLARNAAPALAIVADVVRNPVFPEEEVAREKKRLLDAIAQADRNPNALAGRIRPMLTFGPAHPYGRPAQGLRSTVEPIIRQDLVAFHAARWKPGSTALIFVGDVRLDAAVKLAREHFAGWSGGAAPTVTIPPPAPLPAGRLYVVDRPDAAQTVIAQWLPAPPRKTPDYDALQIVDAVWAGGGFGNRLNMNLREAKGYSYGVFSTFALLGHGGHWYASGGVQTDKTRESIVEFENEMKALAGGRPITEQELATAKTRRVRGYAQQFESLGRIASLVSELWVRDLPMTELQREYDATAGITLDQALAAVKKYVKPESAGLLLVGDRAKIEGPLRELKLREVVVLDVEGKPVTPSTAPNSSAQ